jgi:hypothetical protein
MRLKRHLQEKDAAAAQEAADDSDDQPVSKAPKAAEEEQQQLLLIDQLHSKEALFAIKKIAESTENTEITELLSQGGSGKDIISVFTDSVEKLKSPDISLVFNACESFLLYVATIIENSQSEDEEAKFKKLALELTREVLEDHLG